MTAGSRQAPRWGLTVPLPGIRLDAHRQLYAALPGWGYTDVWSSEVNGADAFTPLALAAAWQPELTLGTAIVPAFTRGPTVIAQSAASMASASGGRFVLGLGASSPAIVGQWNGMSFDQPYRKTRDMLRFVKAALGGEKVVAEYDTFAVNGFRLEVEYPGAIPVLLAALRPQMLALAGREADGAILNWLAPADVPRCVEAIGNPDALVVARIFVCPTADAEFARAAARRMIAGYLTVPAYAEFHRWLGRAASLESLWTLWEKGERAAAAASIPDEVVDALVIHGDARHCRAQVQAYVDAGVDVPVLAVQPTPELTDLDSWAGAVEGLGPARR